MSNHDEHFMHRALRLAERAWGRTNPNPLVGAVVVRDDRVVAEAFHERPGGPHAEALALQRAGDRARGAELYVNWEPCVSYEGKRTPPCVDAILRAGIRRVVVATRDPTPQIKGRGIARLRRAGVEVTEGVLEKEAKKLNEIRIKYATTRLPFVTLKYAMTLDGKVAAVTGDSRWISSEASLEYAHKLRARYAAVLVGIGTVLRDDPRLTVRKFRGPDPVRIVLDSRGRIPLRSSVLRVESGAPTVIATVEIPPERERALHELQTPTPLEIWRLPADSQGRVSLKALLALLGERGLDSLLVEGGPTVAASFVEQRLADKLVAVIAPKLVGGRDAPSPLAGRGVERMADALSLDDVEVQRRGPDVVIEGYLRYPSSSGEG